MSFDGPIFGNDVDAELLARYVQAFEGYDMDGLAELARAEVA